MRDQTVILQNDLYLQEEKLLDRAVEILGESDALEAYKYLLTEKEKIKCPSSQLYNYLYCLGAVAGMKEEAIAWLKEAIEEKGFWYRPEVFNDSDLESLRSEAIFQKCRKLSEEIQWDKHDSRVLCGFSAGCNEILKSIKCAKIKCEGIVVVSPWIPVIETGMDELLEFMKDNSIWIEVICGKKDDDCMPLAERFAEAAKEKGVQMTTHWIDGLGHQYPNCFLYEV